MREIIEALKVRGFSEQDAKSAAQRWYAWLMEVTAEHDVEKHFEAVSDCATKELIVINNIDAVLICPHHLLPVPMNISIGYMPNGKVLGLSKFARVARALSAPKLQEQYVEDLANTLFSHLAPRWLMVTVRGEHQCMRLRGVFTKESAVLTSAMRHSTNMPSYMVQGFKSEFLRMMDIGHK